MLSVMRLQGEGKEVRGVIGFVVCCDIENAVGGIALRPIYIYIYIHICVYRNIL